MTLLADLVATSGQVAATSSRLAKTEALAALLRRLAPAELEIAIPFLSGEARQGRLAVPFAALREARPQAGSSSLSLEEVDRIFSALKAAKGKGAATKKQALLDDLFSRATAAEADFLARLIIGELRQGALEGVVLEAVAAAASVPAEEVRRAATFAGALAPVARAAIEAGRDGLAAFTIRLMRPVQPMLAQPAQDAESALQALAGPAIAEWKLDGARVQVHKDGRQVKVFTRTLKEVTAALPEVVAAAQAAPARTLILDGEAIALRADGVPYPFQDTMRRFGRKAHDDATAAQIPLSVFFFDCLLADGRPLVDEPLERRRSVLGRSVRAEHLVPAATVTTPQEAAAFYADVLARGHEGIMMKAPGSAYESGRRGGSWLKVKSAHTLDLVVLAAEWGSGRRKGWLSNLHLGARDPQGGFVMLGKTFKGLTDATLEWQTREFLARETGRDEWTVQVRPELVVEIAFNDLQQSSQYPGGMALRFARVKRYRPDKQAADADTIDTVKRLFESQAGR